MTLTIHLTPEEEIRLNASAAQRGMPVEEMATNAVRDSILPYDIQAKLANLRTIMDIGDEEEQRETWEYLKKALDEDRLSYRKLFP